MKVFSLSHRRSIVWTVATFLCCLIPFQPAFSQNQAPGSKFDKVAAPNTVQEAATAIADDRKESKKTVDWKSLIAQETLEGWEITNFGGEGEVEVKDGVMRIDQGDPLSGVTTTRKDFPKENFEMKWKARRVDGSDFFVGVTFPVGKEFCSLIVGGWGGGLVGLSSINGSDASENETTGFHDFKNGTWYSFRLKVDSGHITAWMDEKQILTVERQEGKFSLRGEVYKSRPLGYCSFQSVVEVKEWEYRHLAPESKSKE